MKHLITLLTTVFLASCSSVPVPYSAIPLQSEPSATKIIKQVVMEQPQKYRPQAMHIGSEYLGFDYGTKTRTKALVLGFGSHHHGGFHHGSLHTGLSTGNVTSKTTILGERIYHSSISNISLFKKGNYYFAAISDGSGKITKRVYSLSEKKAKRFADAMYYFINNAPDNFK